MGAAVKADGNPAPVLEFHEHVLDHLALTILSLVIRNGDLATPGRRNTGSTSLSKHRQEPVAIIALVSSQRGAGRQRLQYGPCAFVIAHLTVGSSKTFCRPISSPMA